MKHFLNYRSLLSESLELRQLKNPAYTIGSFGRLLGIDASRMAQILNGKVGISVKRAMEIVEILKFTERDKKIFILLVQAEHDRNPKKRKEAQSELEKIQNESIEVPNVFSSIHEWYYFAIFELINLDNPENTVAIMAKKLGLSLSLTEAAIERMLSLGMLLKIENSNPAVYKTQSMNLNVTVKIDEASIKDHYRQLLEKGIQEFNASTKETKSDYSGIVFRFNSDQIGKIKEKITKLRKEILEEFNSSPYNNSVYNMSIQLFELTGKDEKLS
jgi:uncharacterized protein (TIGR02147 family)